MTVTMTMMRMIQLIAALLFVAVAPGHGDASGGSLANDLKKLAIASPAARKYLENPPRVGATNYFGGLGYYAGEAYGWDFARMLTELPNLCAEGNLVAVIQAADGKRYVVLTTDGLGPFAVTVSDAGGGTQIGLGDSVQLKEVASYYDYQTLTDLRGDVLVATFSPRIVRDAKVRTVYSVHLYVHGGHLEALKHVTEEYPLTEK